MSKLLTLKRETLYDRFTVLHRTYLNILSEIDKANTKEIQLTTPAFIYIPRNSNTRISIERGVGVGVYASTQGLDLARSIFQFVYDSVPKVNEDSYTEDPMAAAKYGDDIPTMAKNFIEILYRSVGNDTNS